MQEERRNFLKTTLGAGVASAATLLAAKKGLASGSKERSTGFNGVVTGTSPKNEILYKKTRNWELFYKSSY